MVELSNIQLTEASNPTEPVTLAALKAWMQVDFADNDAVITAMGKGARQSVEQFLSMPLVGKTVTLDATLLKPVPIPLPYANGVSIVSVKTINADGSDGESVYTYNLRGMSLYGLAVGSYAIEYTVTALASEAINEAIKMEVAERYNNRGENVKEYASSVNGLSQPAQEKAAPYRVIWL